MKIPWPVNLKRNGAFRKDSSHGNTRRETSFIKSFRTETLYAYKDMAYEMTIVKGLGEDSIKRLAELRREMNDRFDRVDARLSDLTSQLALVLQKLDERK